MSIPPDFQFSQNNLQDYVDCPRRFQLRYLLKQRWPALQSEPVLEQERQMKLGERFHQMVQQHQCGLPEDAIQPNGYDPDLAHWWQNYAEFIPSVLAKNRYPEFTLTAPFAGHRIIAKYDLLVIEDGGQLTILDWKTSRRQPGRTILKQRLQTRLYPFLVVLAGAWLNGGRPVQPEQVEMVYWYPEFPDQPEHFCYDPQQFEEDRQEIYRLITQLVSTTETVFFSTTRDKNCIYCSYRSLCGRGEQAGSWDECDLDVDPELSSLDQNFNQIGEIRF